MPARSSGVVRWAAIAASAVAAVSASAHPGGHHAHADVPLPAWTLADGRVLAASLTKTDAGRAFLADAAGVVTIVAVADLSPESRSRVAAFESRVAAINAARADAVMSRLFPVAAAATPAPRVESMPPAPAPPADEWAHTIAAVADAPPEIAKSFAAFKRVKTRADADYLYVESDGLPDHAMMKGIRNWQQQVPLPQNYTGQNAWRIPLRPVPADKPQPIKNDFLRGAIALAVNGVPIFNPQNNRGEIAQEIGELDEWGGHCGRADDYHYHVVPLHLADVAGKGKGKPLAWALDGYPIFGPAEPDGSPAGKLDENNGHTTAIGYHYHASNKWPYVIGGFHGKVTQRDGQVDPQPRANPVRPAGTPLRGAVITAFNTLKDGRTELIYEVAGKKSVITYGPAGDGFKFVYQAPDGTTREETYSARDRRGGGGNPDRPPREEPRPPRAPPR